MMTWLRCVLTVMTIGVAAALFGGCDNGEEKKGSGDPDTKQTGPKDGGGKKGSDADDDHKGHKHEGEDGDEHADAVDLGSKTVGAWKLSAERLGHLTAGDHAGFHVTVTGGQPKNVRLWVGTETGDSA